MAALARAVASDRTRAVTVLWAASAGTAKKKNPPFQ